jgi:hypothetical protein
VNLSRPDVQINPILKGIGFCSSAASYYEVFRAVDRVAHNVEVSGSGTLVGSLFPALGPHAETTLRLIGEVYEGGCKLVSREVAFGNVGAEGGADFRPVRVFGSIAA